jgi:hypothetical protein
MLGIGHGVFYLLFSIFSPVLEQSLICPAAFLEIILRYLQAIAAESRMK